MLQRTILKGIETHKVRVRELDLIHYVAIVVYLLKVA